MTLPFLLATDWSQEGLGVVLNQVDANGDEYAVAFASRSCNDAEKNYSCFHGEYLAVIWAVHYFR